MTTTNEISVSEALHKIDSGESVKTYIISFDHIKVEALDVMKLAKHGIVVPDEAVYYNKDDIEMDDEDFAGEWKRIDYDPASKYKLKMPSEFYSEWHLFSLLRNFKGDTV